MIAGEILYYKNFPYEDGGEPTNKLLIVLNDPQNNDPYLVLRTTSQQRQRLNRQGCHASYFVFTHRCDYFREPYTWILFDTLSELNPAEFLTWTLKKGVEKVGNLKPVNLQAVKNCIKRSPDVSKYRQSLL